MDLIKKWTLFWVCVMTFPASIVFIFVFYMCKAAANTFGNDVENLNIEKEKEEKKTNKKGLHPLNPVK